MMRSFDLPEVLPLFVLSGAILLPRARLPLQLFEPRYLQMLEDVLKTPERLIGIMQKRDDGSLAAVGGAGRVTGFVETEDGRYMITLSAVSRFRLSRLEDGFTPYRRGRVDWAGFERDRAREVETDPGLNRTLMFDRLSRFFDMRSLETDWDGLRQAEDELLINGLSMMLPFEASEKQALLEAASLTRRREALSALIDYELATGGSDEETLQ
ncbi:LON peptidase substrate-binding domain-containing protein [Paracoccus sp. p4-l81]|uniref:LON peptidase substrate-binding domain-containing protein n=1 Tax=unclassified Paracoccus (in: a-proteobacteria) TaxID=2688777 RepID=UPI0035BA948C